MIQRLQSVWLLLASFLTFLTYRFPFYSGNVMDKDGGLKFAKLIASYDFILMVLTAILGAGCLLIIFLYRDRKLQLRAVIFAIILSIVNIILYFNNMRKFSDGNLSFAAILSFLVPILLFLAARGIWKDQKLVKSLDRLR